MARNRIGIFSGSFDPVHTGHLTFALKAIQEARLDIMYFLPERQPRGKPEVEHFGHRTAMLSRAIRPYQQLGILELPDVYFDVKRTLPKLQAEFTGADLVFLMGSDAVLRLNPVYWPGDDLETFLSRAEIIIGMRAHQSQEEIAIALGALPRQPIATRVISLPHNHISSSRIRQAFRHNQKAAGLLTSVSKYARDNWLYVSVVAE